MRGYNNGRCIVSEYDVHSFTYFIYNSFTHNYQDYCNKGIYMRSVSEHRGRAYIIMDIEHVSPTLSSMTIFAQHSSHSVSFADSSCIH